MSLELCLGVNLQSSIDETLPPTTALPQQLLHPLPREMQIESDSTRPFWPPNQKNTPFSGVFVPKKDAAHFQKTIKHIWGLAIKTHQMNRRFTEGCGSVLFQDFDDFSFQTEVSHDCSF